MKDILVVDDNVDGGTSLQIYLELLGHHVELVHTGSAALERIKRSMPEVIFLDIGLPDMTGYEVAKAIRSETSERTPLILAITGWGTQKDKDQAMEAGCDAHFTKPIDVQEIEMVLDQSETTS